MLIQNDDEDNAAMADSPNFDIMAQFLNLHPDKRDLLKSLCCEMGLKTEVAIYAILATNANTAADVFNFLYEEDENGTMQHEFVAKDSSEQKFLDSNTSILRSKKFSRSLVAEDSKRFDLEGQTDLRKPLVKANQDTGTNRVCLICDKPESMHVKTALRRP